MKIRLMTIADYDTIYLLWHNIPGMGLNQQDDSRKGISRYLQRNPQTCFVALEGDAIIGVILSGHDGRRGFIYHLAVDPAYQRQGIGKGLVENALLALKHKGIHKVALVVYHQNESGNAFWEKIGFTARPGLVYRSKALIELEYINGSGTDR